MSTQQDTDAPDSHATVLIVDDEATVRRSAARLLRSEGFVVETFDSPANFLRHPIPAGPTCVLLDMYMDGMTGLEVQRALRQSERNVPVVFLSGLASVADAVAGLKQGAEDFLEKPFGPDELLLVVRRAVERDGAGRADREARAERGRRHGLLTAREKEVMALVVSGLLNKQAAARLGVSEKTVKVHRARVMEKMNVGSLAELVLAAEQLGVTASEAGGADAGWRAGGGDLCWGGRPWRENAVLRRRQVDIEHLRAARRDPAEGAGVASASANRVHLKDLGSWPA